MHSTQCLMMCLRDIQVTPEHMTEDGDTFAGIVAVKAKHRVSGKPIEFESSFIGTFKDGEDSLSTQPGGLFEHTDSDRCAACGYP